MLKCPKQPPKKSICHFQKLEMILKLFVLSHHFVICHIMEKKQYFGETKYVHTFNIKEYLSNIFTV